MAAIYTLKDLRDQTLLELNEVGNTSNTAAQVNNAINKAHQLRLTTDKWPFMLWDRPQTFPLVAGVQSYSLHQEFLRPVYIINQTTREPLVEVPIRELEALQIDWNSQQGTNYYTLWGRSPVLTQPTAASTVRIVSSSAADTITPVFTIEGTDSNDEIVTEDLVANGTSNVTSTATFTKILGITKSTSTIGTVTITAPTTSQTLLRLGPAEYGKSYQQLYLLSSPQRTDTIEYRFYRQPRKLTADNDIPQIPPPFSQVLVFDALVGLSAFHQDPNSSARDIWAEQQSAFDLSMRQTFLEGQSMAAQPRFIRAFDEEDWPFPRMRL